MKIVALNGLLGYGYTSDALEIAFSEKVDYVGVDAGSTDPGPYYLGSGKSFTDRGAVKRDLALALPKALSHKAPFIIGTAGGAGSDKHVEWLKDILLEIDSLDTPVVFMLWGGPARKLNKYIHKNNRLILEANHPSPLSANRGGWFGCNHFIKCNEYLEKHNLVKIDWYRK